MDEKMAEQETMDLVVLEGKVFDVIGVNDAKIAQAAEKFMPLTIKDMDDKVGYATVHEGRMVVKGMRIMVEKHAKKVREKAVKFQKAVLTEEKRVIGLIQPIEDHLADEESRVDEEKARIKIEAEKKEADRIQTRVNRLFAMGCRFDGTSYIYGKLVFPHVMVKIAPDAQFEVLAAAIQDAVDTDIAKKAAEEKERQERETSLRKIAEEQELERQRLAKESKAIQDEKDRLEREKKATADAKIKAEQEWVRTQEMEKAKAEAAEKARLETEERIKRDAEAKATKEEATRIRAARKEARRPDKAKLLSFVDTFLTIIQPELKTEDGQVVWNEIWIILQRTDKEIRALVEKL